MDDQQTRHWHQLEIGEVATRLNSDVLSGLAQDKVAARRQKHGSNELVQTGGRKPIQILAEQFRGTLVVLLVVAAVISVYLHEYVDAGAILAIVLLNALLGFVQDYRAENALAALKKLSVPLARVRRDGHVQDISSRDLVPGDMVLLEAGGFVPADCRVVESFSLRIQESALTGESETVEKQIDPLPVQILPLGDRRNMGFMGTVVTYGHGQAIVTETGMNTELGRIAHSLQTVASSRTPLQRRLAQLGRILAAVAIVIVAIVFLVGILRGENPKLMLMTALSMAVAIVPEGLPAVATVALAIGARRMLQRKALIRRLPAVETLGSVTVICSDKTGTLTENRMTVTTVDVAGNRCDLAGGGLDTCVDPVALLLAGAALCNDAELNVQAETVIGIGDPTESALLVAAAELGLPKDQLAEWFPRIDEIPFDSDRKRMTTVHRFSEQPSDDGSDAVFDIRKLLTSISIEDNVVFTKGAALELLSISEFVLVNDQPEKLNDSWRERIIRSHDELAGQGIRVLGVACRGYESSRVDLSSLEESLIFVGLIGMNDPPRAEVREAVARCRTAGIRPVMITGDHPLTALHIARQLGLSEEGQGVLTGTQLSKMSVAELDGVVDEVSVYARVAPRDKLDIVRALQDRGHTVAMTGDGVNDAPALKQAHIGVAMGITGTDVAKEASEMVLLDDNFTTIVNAVEEGRIVYDNIRKFVKYTMTSNAGEIWVMVLGPLMGMPLPLLPLQILWINLVTDGLPGLALAAEPAERDTMRRPPLPAQESVFGRGMARDIGWIGLVMGIVSLALGYFYWAGGTASDEYWRTIIFTVLTLSQMGNALAIRSAKQSLLEIGIFSNKTLLFSIALTFLLQLAVIYAPPLQNVFRTTGLTAGDLFVCLALSTIVFLAVEAAKWASRFKVS